MDSLYTELLFTNSNLDVITYKFYIYIHLVNYLNHSVILFICTKIITQVCLYIKIM